MANFSPRLVASAAALLALAAALAGCQGLDRRFVPQPGENQVMRVQSGDRWYFTLDEGGPNCRWDCVCDDPDVEVTIDHEDCGGGDGSGRVSYGRAKVRVRIHRGYDGPSTIRFFCRKCRDRKGAPDKPFTICLYRRTGDAAFWE